MISRPYFGLTDSQIRARLFWRAFQYALLQAAGVWFIAHGSYVCGVTGFLISLNWATASREVNDHRVAYGRLCYGLGGGAGTLMAVWCAKWLLAVWLALRHL